MLDLLVRNPGNGCGGGFPGNRGPRARAELFRLWASSLSDEALVLVRVLREGGTVTPHEAILLLRNARLDPLRGERAQRELEYTKERGGFVVPADWSVSTELFWQYAAEVCLGDPTGLASDKYTSREAEVWRLVERVELGLRELVRGRYETTWPGGAELKNGVPSR